MTSMQEKLEDEMRSVKDICVTSLFKMVDVDEVPTKQE